LSLVVDASVAIKWLLPEAYSDECLALLDRNVPIYVPDFLVSQVGNGLAKRVKTGDLKSGWAEEALAALLRLPLIHVPIAEIAHEAMSLAGHGKRPFHDAAYLALAVREDVPLITADWRWYALVSNGPLKDYVKFVRDA
jgi:predicted nucleic acid-binding protein